MWTRREVKARGKEAMHKNYWKFVLASLLLGLVVGSAGGASSGVSSSISNMGNIISNRHSSDDYDYDDYDEGDYDSEDYSDSSDLDGDGSITVMENGKITGEGENYDFSFDPESGEMIVDGKEIGINKPEAAAIAGIVIATVLVVAVICFIIGIIGIAMDIFLYNPIEYGILKFFKKSLKDGESLGTMFHGFKDGYLGIVKVMFFRDLFIFLWSLLFIIPGIVKGYAYLLVPYILSENPSMSKDEALKESNRLMMGNKWKAFVLDLSFIGWGILSALTLGVLGIFYVSPYKNGTNAALYEKLKEEKALIEG
ncbi:MAG: DUF975 family protein [Lachnospiraceae bacterium]|nr:DUF975 family protein [Lachnospiraceae bacterium]